MNENNNKDLKEGKIDNNKSKTVEIFKNKKRKSNNGNNKSLFNNNKKKQNIAPNRQNIIRLVVLKNAKDSLSDSKNLVSKDEFNSNQLANLDKELIKEIGHIQIENLDKSSSEKEGKEKEDLTDYELNELEYDEALELDNRNFLKIYWYLLKREHIILFTFFNWNDFNLFAIKLSKLFLSVCSDMAFNVFFFSDESMHNMYESGGEYDFAGQFAQMVYSTMISQLLQIFVNFLTMTDIDYYKLKELKKDNNLNGKEALSVIKCIKIKIIVYFCSTFLMFLFFWYAISAFCAVYQNTQGIFVADSYMSFLMGLVYPFAIYLAPTALRFLSLKAKKNKNLKILYSLSDKVPFF